MPLMLHKCCDAQALINNTHRGNMCRYNSTRQVCLRLACNTCAMNLPSSSSVMARSSPVTQLKSSYTLIASATPLFWKNCGKPHAHTIRQKYGHTTLLEKRQGTGLGNKRGGEKNCVTVATFVQSLKRNISPLGWLGSTD